MAKLAVLKQDVQVLSIQEEDYICITDIARYKNADATDDLIRNWLRNLNTIEFLGIGEQINNPSFNPIEFDGIKKEAGLNSFILTAKQWITRTGAIGLKTETTKHKKQHENEHRRSLAFISVLKAFSTMMHADARRYKNKVLKTFFNHGLHGTHGLQAVFFRMFRVFCGSNQFKPALSHRALCMEKRCA